VLLHSGLKFRDISGGGLANPSPPPFLLEQRGAEDSPMFRIFGRIVPFLLDENGGEVIEYAVVSGLIVMAAISVIGKVGTKVLARWNSLNSSL
jgi:Flp pilus assembly pilin Flp